MSTTTDLSVVLTKNAVSYDNEVASLEVKLAQAKQRREYYDVLTAKLASQWGKMSELFLSIGLEPIINSMRLTDSDPSNIRLCLDIRGGMFGKMKPVTFRGYDRGGAGKNQDTLNNKAKKICEAFELKFPEYNISVNPFSLEIKEATEKKVVLINVCIS